MFCFHQKMAAITDPLMQGQEAGHTAEWLCLFSSPASLLGLRALRNGHRPWGEAKSSTPTLEIQIHTQDCCCHLRSWRQHWETPQMFRQSLVSSCVLAASFTLGSGSYNTLQEQALGIVKWPADPSSPFPSGNDCSVELNCEGQILQRLSVRAAEGSDMASPPVLGPCGSSWSANGWAGRSHDER